ncbi:serine hydrolase domain-containing protein [Streptomyces roseoviridis]|uniref:Serine hydrolase domain-containing protein n=1 Tax=Streptomyces roseoviridis TaxID=67361 RepID=A0ABV5QJ12_9ACTN
MKNRLMWTAASLAALALTATGTATATPAPAPATPPAATAPALRTALDEVHRAGVPGVFAEVRRDGRTWRGASGVADLATGRPVTPGMRQRIGSVTKTFVAAAVMRQVERGRIDLDAPVARYLPDLVPGERGRRITVRMLLNHTSGIPDYIPYAFPSLQRLSPESIDAQRFRHFEPRELIELGLAAPPAAEPGTTPGVYSNTNSELLGQLLERVTGTPAVDLVTRDVIHRAGLRHTAFPTGPRVKGPHSRMYESLHGLIDPARDYSVYDMSWVMMGAGMVSTTADLDRFYAELLAGRIVSPASLAEMQRTVPVVALDGSMIEYGLGLHRVTTDCGTFWGHDGTVWGAGTISLTRADGRRQMSVAVNLMRWNALDPATGEPRHHPIDDALKALYDKALCGNEP